MTLPEEVPVVPSPSEDRLTERQLVDYHGHREDLLEWLYAFGKEPDRATGFSKDTVVRTAYRIDQFYRWVWEEQGYTTNIDHSEADSYVRHIASSDHSQTHKSNTISALQRLFKWKANVLGSDPWEPPFTISRNSSATQPRDFLTAQERPKLREAALEYGSVPSYDDLTPEKRSRWKEHLAQRFGKPIEAITPDDWDRANGWKIPSLVWTSLDAGLRPIEVERATIGWIDTENGVLRIPKDESSKNRDNWIVGLSDRTADSLERWVQERRTYPKYDDSDSIWLTREGNPYTSQSLRYLVGRLCDEANISTESRSMSWYSIRHSVGTYMTREEDLAAAAAQLRHKSTQTTMRYDNTPVEDRKDALERMG